jgi:Flp pilus assembly protein CpaB
MTYRLRNIVLAVVLAVLAALLTAVYVANYQNRVDEGQELVKVYVAKTDIPPGTPAASLSDKVTQKEVQERSAAPAVVYDIETLEGQSTSQWIYTGEQVSARRFSTTGRTGIHAELKGNLRALQLAGSEHQLLAGVLKTGDHVDLIANLKVGDQAHAARVVLRDLLVLKAPSATGIDAGVTSAGSENYSAILQMTDAQANKFVFVTTNQDHKWTLQLRPVADAADSPESLATLPSVLRDGLARNQTSSTGGNR